MDNYLQQGIMAAKTGNEPRAFDLLIRASEVPATSEQAWLWLSSIVKDDAEKLYCLDNVLKMNPDNAAARRGADMLRQRGAFPAIPAYPEPQLSRIEQSSTTRNHTPPFSSPIDITMPVRTSLSRAASKTGASQTESTIKVEWDKNQLSSLFHFATLELSNKKSPKTIEKLLVGRGASSEMARMVVKDVRYAMRKERRAKYKKRLARGLVWTVVGVAITLGTYAFASELGGKFVLFYGAIIFGFFDFLVGLVGWLANA